MEKERSCKQNPKQQTSDKSLLVLKEIIALHFTVVQIFGNRNGYFTTTNY